jgi:hypothetical protein
MVTACGLQNGGLMNTCYPFNLPLIPEDQAPRNIALTISGTITKSGGGPAVDASVQLKQDGSPVGSPVLTGADGQYAISNAAAGTYTITVSLHGYEFGTIPDFTVSGDGKYWKSLGSKSSHETPKLWFEE